MDLAGEGYFGGKESPLKMYISETEIAGIAQSG